MPKGFRGSWFEADVTRTMPKSQRHTVKYESLLADNNIEDLKELVSWSVVRPRAPVRTLTDSELFVGQRVEAYHNDGWWVGIVSKVVGVGRWRVSFPYAEEEDVFGGDEIRIRFDWDGSSWVQPSPASPPGFPLKEIITVKEERVQREGDRSIEHVPRKRRGRPPKKCVQEECVQREEGDMPIEHVFYRKRRQHPTKNEYSTQNDRNDKKGKLMRDSEQKMPNEINVGFDFSVSESIRVASDALNQLKNLVGARKDSTHKTEGLNIIQSNDIIDAIQKTYCGYDPSDTQPLGCLLKGDHVISDPTYTSSITR